LCGVLLVDSLTVALAVTIPVAVGLWLCVLRYLIRGIGAANRGERLDVPAWICARIAKPWLAFDRRGGPAGPPAARSQAPHQSCKAPQTPLFARKFHYPEILAVDSAFRVIPDPYH
jgi:hypothetical protein